MERKGGKLLVCTQVVDKDHPILGFFHGWLLEFARYFDEVEVICLEEGVYELPGNVRVRSLGKEKGARKITQLVRFYLYFAHAFFGGVDYVFFHMGAIYNILAAPFFLLRKLTKTKFYWWKTHGHMDHLKERLAFWCCDRVLTGGSKSFGFTSPKVKTVGHAIDLNLFVPKEPVEREVDRCLSVGRITPIKKLEYTIDIIYELKKLDHEIKLDILGTVDDTTYQIELQKQIDRYQLNDVSFIGSRNQSELSEEYNKANILLHPIYQGGLDKVVLEAMAMGVVPLTSILSYEPILKPFGLYIEAGDINAYVNAVERILQMTDEDRRELNKALREIVERGHSLNNLPERIFGVS